MFPSDLSKVEVWALAWLSLTPGDKRRCAGGVQGLYWEGSNTDQKRSEQTPNPTSSSTNDVVNDVMRESDNNNNIIIK